MTNFIVQAKFMRIHQNILNTTIKVGLLNGHIETFDTVVCSVGFYRSRFHAIRNELLTVIVVPEDDKQPFNVLYITADLCVTQKNANVHENIWLVQYIYIFVALHISVLFIN